MSQNPYAEFWDVFTNITQNHTLHVLHDSGLYRHIRMAAPGTMDRHFEVMTWPGGLMASGDIVSDYIFNNDLDMLDVMALFRLPDEEQVYYDDGAPALDFDHFTQHLSTANHSHMLRVWSPDKFADYVFNQLDEHQRGIEDEIQALDGSAPVVNALKGAGPADDTFVLRRQTLTAQLFTLDSLRERAGDIAYSQDLGITSFRERQALAEQFLSDEAGRYIDENWRSAELTSFNSSFIVACYAANWIVNQWGHHQIGADPSLN